MKQGGTGGFLHRVRVTLFAATGVAVPLFAFPVFRVFKRDADAATVAAGLFVALSIPALIRMRGRMLAWSLAAVYLPLLVLLARPAPAFNASVFGIAWIHWLIVTGFFAAATTLTVSGRTFRSIVLAQLIAGSLVSLGAFYQIAHPGWSPGVAVGGLLSMRPIPFKSLTFGRYTQPTSVFLEPSWMGGYLVWVIAAAAALLVSSRGTPAVKRLPWVGMILVCLTAILATVSWGAYLDLGLVLVVLVLSLLTSTEHRRTAAAAVLVGILCAVVALQTKPGRLVAEGVRARFETTAGPLLRSPFSREKLYAFTSNRSEGVIDASRFFLRHPVVGIGLRQVPQFQRYENNRPEWNLETWTGWVTIAAEMGLPGFLLLASALWLAATRDLPRDRTGSRTAVARFGVPSLLALLIVQQCHTATYVDLWWWFPVSLLAVMTRCLPNPEASI